MESVFLAVFYVTTTLTVHLVKMKIAVCYHLFMRSDRESFLNECPCAINFIKQVEKSNKTRVLPSILSPFCNEFKNYINMGALRLDSF